MKNDKTYGKSKEWVSYHSIDVGLKAIKLRVQKNPESLVPYQIHNRSTQREKCLKGDLKNRFSNAHFVKPNTEKKRCRTTGRGCILGNLISMHIYFPSNWISYVSTWPFSKVDSCFPSVCFLWLEIQCMSSMGSIFYLNEVSNSVRFRQNVFIQRQHPIPTENEPSAYNL